MPPRAPEHTPPQWLHLRSTGVRARGPETKRRPPNCAGQSGLSLSLSISLSPLCPHQSDVLRSHWTSSARRPLQAALVRTSPAEALAVPPARPPPCFAVSSSARPSRRRLKPPRPRTSAPRTSTRASSNRSSPPACCYRTRFSYDDDKLVIDVDGPPQYTAAPSDAETVLPTRTKM